MNTAKLTPSVGMPNIKAVTDERAIYDMLVERFSKEGKVVSPGYFRVEKKIYNGYTKYEFNMVRDNNSDTTTERKMDRNDKFFVMDLGLFLMKRDDDLVGAEILQTYPNPTVFADDSTNFIGAHLEALYNGSMGLKVKQTNFIEAIDSRRFRYVPTSQEFTFNSTTSKIPNSGQDENSGMVKLTPGFMLDGDVKSAIMLEAPVASGHKVQQTVSGYSNYLVLVGRGFLISSK